MMEPFFDTDNKSRNDATDKNLFFDDNAWDEIESLLNKDDKSSDADDQLCNDYPFYINPGVTN